jgi:hypothetical protein
VLKLLSFHAVVVFNQTQTDEKKVGCAFEKDNSTRWCFRRCARRTTPGWGKFVRASSTSENLGAIVRATTKQLDHLVVVNPSISAERLTYQAAGGGDDRDFAWQLLRSAAGI